MENIKEVLSNLGYDLKEYLKEYRTKPLYRDSDNENVLVIYKDSGKWVDYKENITGNLQDLVRMTLNLPNNVEAKEWISKKVQTESSYTVYKKPEIKQVKCYSSEVLDKLVKDHSFWKNRNISEETMNLFGGGILTEGRMKGRYVFPILNKEQKLIGVAGRDILNRSEKMCPKWKLVGDKINWRYPLQVNSKILSESKEVIIVESIGDMLSLWEAGIKNVIVTFGLTCFRNARCVSLNNNDHSKILVPKQCIQSCTPGCNKSSWIICTKRLRKRLISIFVCPPNAQPLKCVLGYFFGSQ